MSYQYLTNKELLKVTKEKAILLREHTLELLELLCEVDERKLYCEMSFGSLFKYIVEELKFSDSQAAIYNNLVKSKLAKIIEVKELIKKGELTTFNASMAAQIIREQKIQSNELKLNLVKSFAGISKIKAINSANEMRNKVPLSSRELIIISQNLKQNILILKRKFNLPENMRIDDLLDYLVIEKLFAHEEVSENKTVTTKTKNILKVAAKYQCEYLDQQGKRCQETRYLEVDHVVPKSLGGNNHYNNLRIYCREHNQKSAMNNLGSHIIHKRG